MLTNISDDQILRLETQGFTVFRETNPALIEKYNTDIWIVDKNGLDRPYWDELWQIPVLPPGTEGAIGLNNYQMPYEVQYENCGAYLHLDPTMEFSKHGMEVEYALNRKLSGAPINWVMVGVIILISVLAAIVAIFLYSIVDRINIIHGRVTQINEVDDATKAVTKPNCQARLWDSVNHKWVEGDDWSEPGTTPGEELARWILYAVGGLVAFGAIYLVVTLVKSSREKAYYRAYPQYPPPEPEKKGFIRRRLGRVF